LQWVLTPRLLATCGWPQRQVRNLGRASGLPKLRLLRAPAFLWLFRTTVLPVSERVESLVKVVAARRPSAVAVSDSQRVLTYGELDRFSDELSQRLRSLGVDRGVFVGLCVERSVALAVGALGILKAGGVYVALDPSYPQERLSFMLRDSGAGILVGSSETPRALCSEATFVDVDLAHLTRPAAGLGVAAAGGGNDAAYLIYTSGSSGNPKGVLVEHRSLLNLIRWHQRAFAVTPADRGTQIASPGFDAAVWEIWPYLTAGASIHVPPDEIRADPAALRDWLLTQEITISFVPTALAEAVMAVPWPSRAPLRSLLTGGDVLFRPPPPGLPFDLVNNYGVTEATVVSTSGVIPPCDEGGLKPSLGRPIAGVHIHLVGDDLRPVELGEAGEVLIGGLSVARGYHDRPDLTRERFLPDYVGGETNEVVYRTGDLGRWRPDGELEFLGRLDDQVTINGVRMEPGEVEALLNSHPTVRSSVVLAAGVATNRRLVAYLVPAHADPPDSELLRSHLCRHLPEAMLPASFIWQESLPYTANGKIDRAALHLIPLAVDTTDTQPSANGSTTEHAIAILVAELLEVESVGIDEDFFLVLGGHSLLGTQLIARLSDLFGVELSLRVLFDNPTAAGLAGEVERALAADISSLSDAEAERQLSELVDDD
jgi:amino acid adenylation domain-containing protein